MKMLILGSLLLLVSCTEPENDFVWRGFLLGMATGALIVWVGRLRS